jgi:hypothetical protein
MKLAVTGPLPIPAAAYARMTAPAQQTAAPASTLSTQAPALAQPMPGLKETIRGGLTWAAISNLIGALPGRI